MAGMKIQEAQKWAYENSKVPEYTYKYTTEIIEGKTIYVAPNGVKSADEESCKIYEKLLDDYHYKLSQQLIVID